MQLERHLEPEVGTGGNIGPAPFFQGKISHGKSEITLSAKCFFSIPNPLVSVLWQSCFDQV